MKEVGCKIFKEVIINLKKMLMH